MPICTVEYFPSTKTYELHFQVKSGSTSYWNEVKDVTNVIKVMVPASHRQYDPTTKIWTIDESYYDSIAAVARAKGFSLKLKTQAQVKNEQEYTNDFFYNPAPVAPQINVSESLEVLLGVSVTTLPFDELKRAYRRKALELHPDRNNGDGSKMSELNSLWTLFNSK